MVVLLIFVNFNITKLHMKIETLAIHAGNHGDPTTGAVVPPLILSTTFERANDGSLVEGRDIYIGHQILIVEL